MWLINTESLELDYFVGKNIPHYAILSHTWGDEEVTFQDWKDLKKASKKRGFVKITSACDQAGHDSLDYLWVDTNCIDKSSSAELSEAINSMFSWYKDSDVCYVYLADVGDPDDVCGKLLDESEVHEDEDDELDMMTDIYSDGQYSVKGNMRAKFEDSFRKSKWFTRGWTLQELIAPSSIRFFTQEWKPIIIRPHRMARNDRGSKQHEGPLLELLSDITSIRLDALYSSDDAMGCSIGEKMSWMAGRETTREEDMAYCLLGLFDINMPLLYGEGNKAFNRLQEEIINRSTDHSLFAWQWPQGIRGSSEKPLHLFARSTVQFSNLNDGFSSRYKLKFKNSVDMSEEDNL